MARLRPFPAIPDRAPSHPQFSCASLDAVVNYFVSHTNKALVPFLLDEDYEKVLGGCGFRELGGPSPRLSCPHPVGGTRVSARPPRLLQAALSVPGYVEANKENGESAWVAPSVPADPRPGDAPSPRLWLHMVLPVSNLVPRCKVPEIIRALPSSGFRQSWTQTPPSLYDEP